MFAWAGIWLFYINSHFKMQDALIQKHKQDQACWSSIITFGYNTVHDPVEDVLVSLRIYLKLARISIGSPSVILSH